MNQIQLRSIKLCGFVESEEQYRYSESFGASFCLGERRIPVSVVLTVKLQMR